MVITLSRYEAGEVIVQENDVGETAYVIDQGQVEVSKDLDGQTVHLAYLGAGETFGEMSMIDEKPRSATVTAVTETVVRELRRDDFFTSLQTEPQVALTLALQHGGQQCRVARLQERRRALHPLRQRAPTQADPGLEQALRLAREGRRGAKLISKEAGQDADSGQTLLQHHSVGSHTAA
jgi:CRP-like cAMP-binding protein